MTATQRDDRARRSGPETRNAIQRVALGLFTERGYEATSMREIAEALGIKKASLYYHFAGKEEIVRSLFAERGNEAEDLLDWIRRQPSSPDLPRTAVLRWVDSFSSDKLHGIRFLAANPLLLRTIAEQFDDRIGATLSALVEELASHLRHPSAVRVLQLRMALLSINAAVAAAARGAFADEEILAAARRSATVIMDSLQEAEEAETLLPGRSNRDRDEESS